MVDLGIKKPVEENSGRRWMGTNADAVGMQAGFGSGRTVVMEEKPGVHAAARSYSIPVVLGGAALDRHYVEASLRHDLHHRPGLASDASDVACGIM